MQGRDCAILLTHRWWPGLALHVERLKRETAGVLDVFLVLSAGPDQPVPAGMAPDIVISASDADRLFPTRQAAFARRKAAKKGTWAGYVDLTWIPAFLHPRLAAYDRFWLIEYDVDLKGNWGRFFAAAATYAGDLLLTRVHRLSQDPRWAHARTLKVPPAITDPLLGLFCISRLSRPVIEAYVDAVADPAWDGHFEALLPSLAETAGFTVAEISGQGDWTPPERINRHYAGVFYDRGSAQTTFSVRPPHGNHYFAERRFTPGRRDTLYHPIKTDMTFRDRLRFLEQDLRWSLGLGKL